MNPEHIIISRTDKIGDVVLTLPLAGVLRKEFPDAKISFLGNTYTESVVKNSEYVNAFINWDKIKDNAASILKEKKADTIIHVFPDRKISIAAKKAGIKNRIGTSHRIFHWWTCNCLVNLGRKNSLLHEAQLNIQLLRPLKIKTDFSIKELSSFYGWKIYVKKGFEKILDKDKFNLILHTKSRGSAREWPLQNYLDLVRSLQDFDINFLLSGTKEEGEIILQKCPDLLKAKNVRNITGSLSLSAFIELIKKADGLIACSTGPLHIASASGIFTLGLYPPIKPMHPGRWGPIGRKASFIVPDKDCSMCRKDGDCLCLNELSPTLVKEQVMKWYESHKQELI